MVNPCRPTFQRHPLIEICIKFCLIGRWEGSNCEHLGLFHRFGAYYAPQGLHYAVYVALLGPEYQQSARQVESNMVRSTLV